MRWGVLRYIGGVIILAMLLAGCVLCCKPAGESPPPGGLSMPEAYSAALAAVPDATGVVSAKVGRMGDFDSEQRLWSSDRWVWAVVVSGDFPLSCGPAPTPGQTRSCPPPATTQTVLLDYRTGLFLESFGNSGADPD